MTFRVFDYEHERYETLDVSISLGQQQCTKNI